MYKKDVKRIAQERLAGLGVLTKKESMGICFIGKRPMNEFLSNYMTLTCGRFVDWETGDQVGRHLGREALTLGQKARIGGATGKYFIVAKRAPHHLIKSHLPGDVYVVQGADHPGLIRDKLLLSALDFHWISGHIPLQFQHPQKSCLQFKARYGQTPSDCTVSLLSATNQFHVEFSSPIRALTPGQIFTLYDGDVCLGATPIPSEDWIV
jgi:tRNA U34 2-thiouridine synthase MnmA/TrmU